MDFSIPDGFMRPPRRQKMEHNADAEKKRLLLSPIQKHAPGEYEYLF